MDRKQIAALTAAAAGLAGTGAAVFFTKKKQAAKQGQLQPQQEYRNPARGTQKKNSKGIYYTKGN